MQMVPVKVDSRTCFGLEWYSSEQDAADAALAVMRRGDRYNGGWFDGQLCGRTPEFDYDDPDLGRLFAVTVA